MVGKEMMAFFHDSEDWMIEAGKVINAYDVFAGCCVSSERGRYHLHLRRPAGDLLREGDWSVRLPCPLVRPAPRYLELVGLAVGQVPHALFEAGLGDRLLEVLQG